MFKILHKMILSLLLMSAVTLTPVHATNDYNLTDAQLHAFLGIVTSFILENNNNLPAKPTLESVVPDITSDTNVTIQIHAEVNSTVFLNSIEVGTVDENGTAMITLPLTHGINNFSVTVKDTSGIESSALLITIISNIAPVANELNITVDENSSNNLITLSGTDADGDDLNYTLIIHPLHGTVTIAGSVATYTPVANYYDTDSFSFIVDDGMDDSEPANVNITVSAILTAPILENQIAQNYTKMTAIEVLAFTNTGGNVTSCTVSPSLPAGLLLSVNNGTCEITGIPTQVLDTINYTITATNSRGSDDATVMIGVTQNLLISEVSSAYYINDDIWFEIYNPTTVDIDLSAYTLKSHAYSGSGTIIDSFEFTFPSKTIRAGEYLVIRPNYGPAYNTTLPDIENEYVMYLKDTASDIYPLWFSDTEGFLEILKNGNTVDFVSIGNSYMPTTSTEWTGTEVPSFTSSASEFWKSISRDVNGTDTNSAGDWYVRYFPTYAGKNDVTCNDDVDTDGIPDCSEVNGSTYAGMDLYAFGARVNQKDIFIEVDYMDSSNGGTLPVDEGVVPQQQALQKVQDSFLANGYVVHFDVGDLYAQDGNVTNTAQMDLGGGNEVTYALSVSLDSTSTANNVRTYKVSNMKVQRQPIFYYMLFGTSQNIDGTSGSSGLAEKPGNDSLMTLGGWGLNKNTVASTNALINFQAGTVMHEFGHNLNLGHGGNEDENYKPNYVSVMNYLYQLDGLSTIGDNEGDRYYNNNGGAGCPTTPLTNPYNGDPTNFIIDYSHGVASNLEEVTGIDEANGLGYPTSVPVDYNCNGNEADILTNFNVNPDFGAIQDTVTDHDDWSAINIIFARTYSGASGLSLDATAIQKISINPLQNDVQPVAKEVPIRIPKKNL